VEQVNDDIKPPLTTTTSIWPAAAVLVLAVVVLFVFMGINIISNQGVSTTTTTIPVVVGGLGTDTASVVLQNCHQGTNPPSDIANALLVPVGTRSTGPTVLPNEGAGDFDCYRPLATTTNASSLLAYYAAHLEALGWNLFSTGASNGSPQSLFQKGGSDGFYWVVGITVKSSTKTDTDWTFRIYQNSETI
jgi:hypothetical protein